MTGLLARRTGKGSEREKKVRLSLAVGAFGFEIKPVRYCLSDTEPRDRGLGIGKVVGKRRHDLASIGGHLVGE